MHCRTWVVTAAAALTVILCSATTPAATSHSAKKSAASHPAKKSAAHHTTIIKGLDGGSYKAYKPSVVREAQSALKAQGHYPGEVNGKLDEATIQAIGSYQKQHGLHVSGVPSPATRAKLLPGATPIAHASKGTASKAKSSHGHAQQAETAASAGKTASSHAASKSGSATHSAATATKKQAPPEHAPSKSR